MVEQAPAHLKTRAARVLRALAALAAAVVCTVLVGLVVVRVALAEPRPVGVPGPEAEALAARIEAAIDLEAWARTGAVSWTFAGDHFLWDRERNLVRFEDRRGVVLTEGWRPLGRAFHDDVEVGGSWKDRRVAKAYDAYVNAAFVAFAASKLHDEGAVRAIVDGPSGPALLVSYGTGGVTPGDAYRWEVGPDGLPVALSIWAQVLPLPGATVRWEDWVTLPTGARVATRWRVGPLAIRVTDLEAAATLAELVPGPDPFAPMYGP